ncbi:MAG: oligosaccharide flippase family protein [Pyrinomonadaceae bacterium]|nr:oligosaccharide flippase family protein [Pyrinomonadaceae bacterium]
MAEDNNKTKSLKVQSAWLLFAKIAGFGFAFVLPLIVVRVLSKEEFGLYRLSFLIVTNAVAILPLGISMSAYYYLARDRDKRAAAVLNIVLVHFGVGLLGFLFLFVFPNVLGAVFGSPEMTRLAPLIGCAIWLWLFSMFLEHVAVANQESKLATVFIIFAQFSKTALMVGFVLWFGTVESIIYAAIIQAAIQTAILLIYLTRRFPGFWKSFDPAFLREHIAYALPFGIAGILWTLQVDLHYYFVGYRYGEAALAVYAVGCFQLPLVAMLAESVMSVMIPRMSELQLVDDTKEMIRVTARAMQKLAFAYFPLYVFMMITAETFITTLFTKKYGDSVPIFLIFLTLLPFHIMISDPVVRAYEHLGRFLLKIRVFTFLVLVAGLYLGILYLDMRWIIAIVVGIRIAEMLVVEFVVFRSIGAELSDLKLLSNVLKTGVLSILCGIVTFILYGAVRGPLGELVAGAARSFSGASEIIPEFLSGATVLAVCFFVFAVLYLAGSYAAGTFEESEKQYVRRFLRISNG